MAKNTFQSREYRDDESITLGTKMSGKVATAVHAAAERAGCKSTSEWLRDVAKEAAAKALGVSVASLEPPARPSRAGITQQGASPAVAAQLASYNALMLDLQDKLKQAADMAAMMGQPAPSAKPTRRR